MVKRLLAFVVYTVGALVALATFVAGLMALGDGWGNFYEMLTAVAVAVALWWITAGIGIRLGVFPVEYLKFIARYLSLTYESPINGAAPLTQRPEQNRDS